MDIMDRKLCLPRMPKNTLERSTFKPQQLDNRKPLLSRHKSQAGGGSGARNLVSDYLFVRSVRRASVGPSSTLGISTVAGRLYYRAANEPLRRLHLSFKITEKGSPG